jgi:hypothetical protein
VIGFAVGGAGIGAAGISHDALVGILSRVVLRTRVELFSGVSGITGVGRFACIRSRRVGGMRSVTNGGARVGDTSVCFEQGRYRRTAA